MEEGRVMRARPIILISLVLSIVAGPVRSEDVARQRAGSFSIGAGGFNMGHSHPSSGIGLEYRLDSRPFRPGAGRFALVPAFGITGTSRDALFGYAGLRADFDVTRGWRLTPGFSVGAYERKGDVDLGGPVEFRSSLDVSRALKSGTRIGVTLFHISNARLYDRNPGVNALAFVQAF
jgi:lipid A 3-O-deacylase